MFNQYNPLESYQNTSFNEVQNNSLRSQFLGFGEVFTISFDLFKKRLGNLFLPVLVYQLILFIIFAAIQGGLLYNIFKSVPQGSQVFVTNPIDPVTQNLSKEFVKEIGVLAAYPGIALSILAMIIVFIIYILISQWIEYKSMIMINDKTSKLIDYNIFKTKFVTLVGFYIIVSIIVQIITNILSIRGNIAVDIILGLLSFLFTVIMFYGEIIINYITRLFLYEQNGLFKSCEIIIDSAKKYLGPDILRQFLMGLIAAIVFFVIFFVIGGFAFASLFPLIIAINTNTEITNYMLPLFISAILFFICTVLLILVSWFLECYQYICYYNLRWVALNNGYTVSDQSSIKSETQQSQTLEEKLMEGNTVDESESYLNSSLSSASSNTVAPIQDDFVVAKPAQFVPFEESETEVVKYSTDSQEQKVQAMEEFQMMDINVDEIEEKATPKVTVIGDPKKVITNSAASIINLANIKKSEEKKEESTETFEEIEESPEVTFVASQPQDLKIIEGIGPKIEELLNDAGINTYTALADTDVNAIQDILNQAGSKFSIHNPLNWPKQAALARDGKMEELEMLKEGLNRGM
jgi:predicted flap endonuclease-1-like 5' DNA nuclease